MRVAASHHLYRFRPHALALGAMPQREHHATEQPDARPDLEHLQRANGLTRLGLIKLKKLGRLLRVEVGPLDKPPPGDVYAPIGNVRVRPIYDGVCPVLVDENVIRVEVAMNDRWLLATRVLTPTC